MELSLREARTLLERARRDVERGESPSRGKVEKRTQAAEALTFGGWAENYFSHKADRQERRGTAGGQHAGVPAIHVSQSHRARAG